MWSALRLAGRAAIWRRTPDPKLVGLASLVGWALVLAAIRVALQYLATVGDTPHFNPYGLNATAAWLAIELAVAAFFVQPAARPAALAAMLILSIIADLAATAIELGAPFIVSAAALDVVWARTATTGAVFAVEVVWWLGAMTCVLASLQPNTQLRLLARAAALWVALFAAHTLVPDAPAFVGRNFDIRNANWWEYLYARYGVDRELAQIDQAQPALLKTEVDGLAPPRRGETDIYALGLAGWATQDVFVKELDGALVAIGNILPIKDRTLRLINSAATIKTVPLASPKNFAAAVHAIGAVMDKDADVLVLVMTSHGERSGFALQLPGAPVTELTPQQVASVLDGEGIKNRVVIVSACYAGSFVPALQNDNTIVMTASDANNTSFGCAPQRDWTYFGDALFRQSLQRGVDFEHAFDHARVLISGWELMDRLPPSNPQGSFGPALVARLAPLFQAGPEAR